MNRQSRIGPGLWCALVGTLVAAGCQAEPPSEGTGPGVQPAQGPYASVASCSTPNIPPNPCPGSACAQNATGQPDGVSVDMNICSTLQLTFTTGTLVPLRNVPDLAIHVTALGGATRVEVSEDGAEFTVVGFVGQTPYPEVPDQCKAEVQGNRLLLYFDRCDYLTDVQVVRLQRATTINGGLLVDAIEAMTFRPIGKP